MNWEKIDYRIWVALGVLVFLAVTTLYAAEIPYFNRYFNFSRLMIYSLIFGLISGGTAAWYFGRSLQDGYDRMRLQIGLLFAGILFAPLLLSLINRNLDPWPRTLEKVEFVALEDRFSSRFGVPADEEEIESNTFHIYFYRNDRLTRIVFNKKPDLGGVEEGDHIGIRVRRGLFGLQWVQSAQTLTGETDFI